MEDEEEGEDSDTDFRTVGRSPATFHCNKAFVSSFFISVVSLYLTLKKKCIPILGESYAFGFPKL